MRRGKHLTRAKTALDAKLQDLVLCLFVCVDF
jgi:hypothetical protein